MAKKERVNNQQQINALYDQADFKELSKLNKILNQKARRYAKSGRENTAEYKQYQKLIKEQNKILGSNNKSMTESSTLLEKLFNQNKLIKNKIVNLLVNAKAMLQSDLLNIKKRTVIEKIISNATGGKVTQKNVKKFKKYQNDVKGMMWFLYKLNDAGYDSEQVENAITNIEDFGLNMEDFENYKGMDQLLLREIIENYPELAENKFNAEFENYKDEFEPTDGNNPFEDNHYFN